jgi:RNA binding exosome subunit
VTEEIDIVKSAIYNCLPQEHRDLDIEIRHLQSQFRDKMKYLILEIHKPEVINETVEFLNLKLSNGSKDYLNRYFEKKLDEEEKIFHFRLKKFEAVNGNLVADEGSDVIKVNIKYSDFSYDDDISLIKQHFSDLGILSNDKH